MVDSITESGLPVNWDYLRSEGLKHLQKMTGHLWTDYNIHDPGITLFEALCHGIEELDARISQNIETIIADDSGTATDRYFTPAEILTINPVTINDYRKLLIDIPGVKNAWLEHASDIDPDIYYDKDNNSLLYDYAAKAKKIKLNGLYRVHIEREDVIEVPDDFAQASWDNLPPDQKDKLGKDEWDLLSDEEKTELSADNWSGLGADEKEIFYNQAKSKYLTAARVRLGEELLLEDVKKTLHAHRNLCEDFDEVRIMERETIYLYTDIQIDEEADPNEVMGRIYYELKNFVSPPIRQYGLKQMLKKGKTLEQIYNGPSLGNGFIDSDELGTGEKRRELHTSDLIRIIMSQKEVKDVRKLFVTNLASPTPSDKKEWALVLDDTKALVLEPFNNGKIRIFKEDTNWPVDANKISDIVETLENKARKEALEGQDNLQLAPETNLIGFDQYDSVGLRLPSNFGISETGLPSSADKKRRAQAKQLKGYLLFFEQILVNYLKQLDSFKHLFSLKQDSDEVLKTYFSKRLPEKLWKGDFPEFGVVLQEGEGYFYDYLEDESEASQNQNAFARKNRILNHLLALFNEKFADYAIFGYKYNMLIDLDADLKMSRFLETKADFLRNYPRLSKNRNRAYNTTLPGTNPLNIDGLKDLIATKLGFDAHQIDPQVNVERENFHVIEHILLRPNGKLSLDLVCSEYIEEEFQPDPYSYRLTYVIPKNYGRFRNPNFKQLVYQTIEDETPAHITYRVLEFEDSQLVQFNDSYKNYLAELKTIQVDETNLFNPHRNSLFKQLSLGMIKLPLLHLDANDVFADDDPTTQPNDGDLVNSWKDLSRNNNHAGPIVGGTSVKFVQPEIEITENSEEETEKKKKQPPYLLFDGPDQFVLDKQLIETKFTIAVVFNPSAPGSQPNDYFPLITGKHGSNEVFTLGIKGTGHINASVIKEVLTDGSVIKDEVELGSTLGTPHILILSGDFESAELHLTVDGELYKLKTTQHWDTPLFHQQLIIGAGKSNFSCHIGEIAILDSVLSGARKRKLEEHYSQKWQIPLSQIQSIGTPELHLDANHMISVTSDMRTGKISQWADLSKYKNSAIQVSDSLRPIYKQSGLSNRPSIRFVGPDFLNIDSEADELSFDKFTIAAVYLTENSEGQLLAVLDDDLDNSNPLLKLEIGKGGAIQVWLQAQQPSDKGTTLLDKTLSLTATKQEAHLVVVTGQKIDQKLEIAIYLDGKSKIKAEFTDPTFFIYSAKKLKIGDNLTGDIGEVVIFEKVFSVLERQRLESFLSRKWKIDTTGVNHITNSVVHLDASRLNTVTEKDGRVVQLDDISPFENHAIQEADKRRPIFESTGLNNMGSIQFIQKFEGEDYYEDSLNITRTIKNDFTIFIVFKPDSSQYGLNGNSELEFDVNASTQWTEGAAVIDADCSGKYNDFGISIGKKGDHMIVMAGIGDRVSRDHTIHSRELSFDNTCLITFSRVKESGVVKLYANGILNSVADLADNAILNDARKVKIGAFNSEGIPFSGKVGEVIILDKVLTDANRQKIERYLAAKWSVPIQRLPIDSTSIWLHFDANERETIITNSRYQVTEWEDVDYEGKKVATQKDSGLLPQYNPESLNGMPAVRFNNSFLSLDANLGTGTEFTIMIVYNALSSGNSLFQDQWQYGAALIDNYSKHHVNSGFGIYTRQSSNTSEALLTARIGDEADGGAFPLQRPHIAVIKGDASVGNTRLYIDGLETENRVTPTTGVNLSAIDGLTIGASHVTETQESSGYFHGDIAEIIYLKRVISDLERQNMEKHLSQKWRIDISGINAIAKPVMHLDASKLDKVEWDSTTKKVAQWLDVNGHDYSAIQNNTDKQPVYVDDLPARLPVIHFYQSCLTFPRLVENDFTMIVVYRADWDLNVEEYMPVSEFAFGEIAGITPSVSKDMWDDLKAVGYFNDSGIVLEKFRPHQPGFNFELDDSYYDTPNETMETKVRDIMLDHQNRKRAISKEKFVSIGGINKTLSAEIWQWLVDQKFLIGNGDVKDLLPAAGSPVHQKVQEFRLFLNTIVKKAVINAILADDWFEGVGLIDGNAPGDFENLHKRDFGLLIGKNNRLIGGIGIIGEDDKKVEVNASKDEFHVAVLTRERSTGIVSMTVDNSDTVTANIARGLPLKDSQQFTIGAFNTGGNHFKGDIGEVIILDKALEAEEIKSIQGFLYKKWSIEIDALNTISNAIFHLDASEPESITFDDSNQTVAKWTDKNDRDFSATQPDTAKQPTYITDNQGRSPVIHFDQSCLEFPQMVEEDFSMIVVYKADGDQNPDDFKILRGNAFVSIIGFTSQLSQNTWQALKNGEFIDDDGRIQSSFSPFYTDFNLGLDMTQYQESISAVETEIISVMTQYESSKKAIPKEEFASIAGISKTNSASIWSNLVTVKLLDEEGRVTMVLPTDHASFSAYLEKIIEKAVIDVVLSSNWFEGVGLIDGNSLLARENLYERGMGILIGADNKLIVGVGVVEEDGKKIEVTAAEDEFHVAVFTRERSSGIITLTTEDSVTESEVIAEHQPLNDSQQFTIGAVNTGGRHFKGDIGEIIILDKKLNPKEIEGILRHLSVKWKIKQ